jgi:hypothetical protein
LSFERFESINWNVRKGSLDFELAADFFVFAA